MIELELLQVGEDAIALFRQLQPAALELVRRVQPIVEGLRLA
jgi:hypothetical protein